MSNAHRPVGYISAHVARHRVVDSTIGNALAETVVGLYKTELIRRRGPWRTAEQVELAAAKWVDWRNYRRLDSAANNLPPAEFEKRDDDRHATAVVS